MSFLFRLMLVSTLDGKLSALDVREEGKLLWSVQADSRPLLSSSISKLEVKHVFSSPARSAQSYCCHLGRPRLRVRPRPRHTFG